MNLSINTGITTPCARDMLPWSFGEGLLNPKASSNGRITKIPQISQFFGESSEKANKKLSFRPENFLNICRSNS